MSKKMQSITAGAIANLLLADADCKNLNKFISRNALEDAADKFADEWRQFSLEENFMRNTAPNVPGDKPPGEQYPDRTELKPTPEPVPDPAETETATSSKISIPDYGEAKRFSVAMGGLATAASKLFEIASENQQEKNDARRVAFDWVEETRNSIYDL
jgi:hypothetical protein